MVVVAIWYHVHWRLGYWPLKQSVETPCLLKEVEGKDVCVCMCVCVCVREREREREREECSGRLCFHWHSLAILVLQKKDLIFYTKFLCNHCLMHIVDGMFLEKEYAGSLFLLIFLGENFLSEKGVCWFFHSSWFSYATLVLYKLHWNHASHL